VGPGLEHADQVPSDAANQAGQVRRQRGQAAFPGTTGGKATMLRQYRAQLCGDRIVLLKKREQGTNMANTSWLFVIFGEHQMMAQLIAKRVLMSPLIHKDFPVRHPLLARSNFASVNLNHQK